MWKKFYQRILSQNCCWSKCIKWMTYHNIGLIIDVKTCDHWRAKNYKDSRPKQYQTSPVSKSLTHNHVACIHNISYIFYLCFLYVSQRAIGHRVFVCKRNCSVEFSSFPLHRIACWQIDDIDLHKIFIQLFIVAGKSHIYTQFEISYDLSFKSWQIAGKTTFILCCVLWGSFKQKRPVRTQYFLEGYKNIKKDETTRENFLKFS